MNEQHEQENGCRPEQHGHHHHDHFHHDKFVEVKVVTTAGNYPAEGYETISREQHIQHILDQAKTKLKIVDTDGWVARINGQVISPTKTYAELDLHGEVCIDYGKHEGGGGNASKVG
jgi:hypothetical protein